MDDRSTLIAVYQAYVSTIISNENRRQQISIAYNSLAAAAFAILGLDPPLEPLYVAVPSLLISIIWLSKLNHFERLAKAKFDVVKDLEERIGYDAFGREWKAFNDTVGVPDTFRFTLTRKEMLIPVLVLVASASYIFGWLVTAVF